MKAAPLVILSVVARALAERYVALRERVEAALPVLVAVVHLESVVFRDGYALLRVIADAICGNA